MVIENKKLRITGETYLKKPNLTITKYEVENKTGLTYTVYEFNDKGLEFSLYDNIELTGNPLFKEFYEPEKNYPNFPKDSAAEAENERIFNSIKRFLMMKF